MAFDNFSIKAFAFLKLTFAPQFTGYNAPNEGAFFMDLIFRNTRVRGHDRNVDIAVNDGLGFRILEAREFMWSDKIIAGMLTIGMLGLALDTAVSRLNNHLLRWHRGLEH